MEDYVGKICPFCKTEIKAEDAVKVCPECGIPHHENCWAENKGCTTFGCKEQHYEAQGTNPTDVCSNCGSPIGDGQEFCPKCCAPKNAPKKNVCSKCGAEIQDYQNFCPKCGQKVGVVVDTGVNSAISQFNAGVNKTNEKKRKMPLIIAIGVVAIVIVAILALKKGGGTDFNKMYSGIAGESWCSIASDGTWIKLDTNPLDIDDYCDSVAFNEIESILNDLGFSSSVSEEMSETTALMGKQSDSTDKYEVSWTYHPNNGLEVMFKVKD